VAIIIAIFDDVANKCRLKLAGYLVGYLAGYKVEILAIFL
jgi:hypothetical protein